MVEPEQFPFLVYGLMGRNRGNVEGIYATDEADARRQFHAKYPGWEGTTFRVDRALTELPEDSDVGI